MTPLTPDQRASLDAMTATALHDPEAAVSAAFQAGQVADGLRKEGLPAHVGCALTGSWSQVWITTGPTTIERLTDVLTRLDLVEDEGRRQHHPHGWADIHIQGVEAPLFVLLDATAAAVPA
ncbi:MAG: hypothetical protein JSS57_04450 [Proteobacteria bacterium]|nr:hypothetical protein [Pseudomonadota bacterium]